MTPELRTAVATDIDAMLPHIRAADVAEMAALGKTPEEAMRGGLASGDWTMTGLLDGVPVCMFGVAPISVLNGIGAPWMLATDGLEAAQVPFLRTCRPVVREMLASYPRLINLVDERNTVARRWLRWLGFQFDLDPLDFNGQTFLPFRLGDW